MTMTAPWPRKEKNKGMADQEATYTPLGFGTWSVDASTAKGLVSGEASGTNLNELDTGVKAVRAEVIPEGAIRYRLDGVDPTSSAGNPLPSGAQYVVTTDLRKFRFISQSGTVTVNVELLGR